MSVQFPAFAVTVPAGTAIANPQETDFKMPPLVVDRVRVRIPPGPSGFVGFVFTVGGTPLIPSSRGVWIVGDNEEPVFEPTGAGDASSWSLLAYNLDVFDHTLHIYFDLSLPSAAPSPPLPAIPVEALSSGPVQGV